MKECNQCHCIKPYQDFPKAKNNKDGYKTICKICEVERVRKFNQTILGRITCIYNGQKTSSKARNHPPPNYSLHDLKEWVLNQPIYLKLYTNWKNSNFNTDLAPSLDRVNSNLPYSFNNLQIVSWKENNDAMYQHRKEGKRITKQCKTINQFDLNHKLLNTFSSISIAARQTGFCRTFINKACKTGIIAHGYYWKYQE